MKRQYIRLFSFMIGVTFILSGILFYFVNNYKVWKKNKIEAEIEIADEIDDVYETFYDKEKALSSHRDDLYTAVKDFSAYYTDMPKGYKGVVEKIEEYEELLKEIEDGSSYLKEKCTKRYSVLEANDKCDAYYINLEKSINIFIGDVEFFNSKIKDFNEWIETENSSVLSTEKYSKLDKYESKNYKDSVDLNEDGTYLGMKSE